MCRSINFLDTLKYADVIKAQSDLLATTSIVYAFLAKRTVPANLPTAHPSNHLST
jgi:hypothetical protein